MMAVRFEFTGDAVEMLDGLRDRMHASSRADVLRLALGLLDATYGHTVTIDDYGTQREIAFPATKQP